MSKIGEVRKNTYGTEMEIVEYNGYNNIVVEFKDEHKAKVCTTMGNFNKGCVKNPYDKTVHGIGYIGEGEYKVSKETQHLIARYAAWRNLLLRCYYPKDKSYHNYRDVEVCEDWFNYQKFSEWYEDNFYQVGTERMHIDKDILIKGNRIYSPETCLIVPQRINMLFVSKLNRHGLPNGIKLGSNGKYESYYNGKYLGTFEMLEDAKKIHDEEKRKAVREIAEEYKSLIPNKLYKALLTW